MTGVQTCALPISISNGTIILWQIVLASYAPSNVDCFCKHRGLIFSLFIDISSLIYSSILEVYYIARWLHFQEYWKNSNETIKTIQQLIIHTAGGNIFNVKVKKILNNGKIASNSRNHHKNIYEHRYLN